MNANIITAAVKSEIRKMTPAKKMTKQDKSQVLILAWRIRRDAAKKWFCKTTDILMNECVKTAHHLKDFFKLETYKANLIEIVNRGIKSYFTDEDLEIIVKSFFEGKIKTTAKTRLNLSQFKNFVLNIPNGQERIKRNKTSLDDEAATIKRFSKIAGNPKYEVRNYLNYVMKNDKYFIACNGAQFAIKPRRTITPQGCIYVDAENEQITEETFNAFTVKDIDEKIMSFLDEPETNTQYNINAPRLIAYLETIKSLEKLIDIKDIRIPIQIGEITRAFNLDYLLRALRNCEQFNHRVNISFAGQRLQIKNLAGEVHGIMPINGIESIIPVLKLEKPDIMDLNKIRCLIHT
jgi:hypothetical protein